jgi:hypothetical protein
MCDFANIRLFNMIKAMNGILCYRKVDCACVIGATKLKESSCWGG